MNKVAAGINDTVDGLGEAVETTQNRISDSLDSVDYDKLNDAISKLQESAKKLSETAGEISGRAAKISEKSSQSVTTGKTTDSKAKTDNKAKSTKK